MDMIYYVLLAFVALFVLSSFLQDRSPIPETSGKVHKPASAAELDTLLKSTKHVVVDFYADWCPPCRAIAPVFSQLADAHTRPGKLAFAKINVDHVNAVAGRYGVSAMPTFVFFQGAEPMPVRGVDKVRAGAASVVMRDGGVERIRGADRNALMAVVEALAAETKD
ncbi:unnamed protein product [Discula destructiva]